MLPDSARESTYPHGSNGANTADASTAKQEESGGVSIFPNVDVTSDSSEDTDPRPCVLVVDDNPHMRSYLVGLLFR